MNEKQTAQWSFELIRDIARLAAILTLGNDTWDQILNAKNYDSKRYLKALQAEGWSVNANGSCQVISIKFSDKIDENGNTVKAEDLRQEFESRYRGILGTIEPGQSSFHHIKSEKLRRPILNNAQRGEKDTVIIPESEYARAYRILEVMGISHSLEGYPTMDAEAYSYTDRDEAAFFAGELAENGIMKNPSVREDMEDGKYTVVIPHIPERARIGKISLDDILKDHVHYDTDGGFVVDNYTVRTTNEKIEGDIIDKQHLYRSETVCDSERGYELRITGHPSATAGDMPGIKELFREIMSYNVQMKEEKRFDMIIHVTPVPDRKNLSEIRINYSQKALLDQFNVARHNDIEYYDPKRMKISFDKETESICFSPKQGEPDNSYEFEAYLYAAGFTYDYDRQTGSIYVDMSEDDNKVAYACMLKQQIADFGNITEGLAGLYSKSFGEIPGEYHSSGAQQFSFTTSADDLSSEKDFSEWIEGNRSYLDRIIYGEEAEKHADDKRDGNESSHEDRDDSEEKTDEVNPRDKADNTEAQDKPSSERQSKEFSIGAYVSVRIKSVIDKAEDDFELQKDRIASGEVEDPESVFNAYISKRTDLENISNNLKRAAYGLENALKDEDPVKALMCFTAIRDQIEKSTDVKGIIPGSVAKDLQNKLLAMAEKKGLDLNDQINDVLGGYADKRIAEELTEKQEEERLGGEDPERSSNLYDTEEDLDEEDFERSLSEEDHEDIPEEENEEELFSEEEEEPASEEEKTYEPDQKAIRHQIELEKQRKWNKQREKEREENRLRAEDDRRREEEQRLERLKREEQYKEDYAKTPDQTEEGQYDSGYDATESDSYDYKDPYAGFSQESSVPAEEPQRQREDFYRDTVSDPVHITDVPGSVDGAGTDKNIYPFDKETQTYSSVLDDEKGVSSASDRSSNLYDEAASKSDAGYGQSQTQKDIENYEETRDRKEQERAEKALRDREAEESRKAQEAERKHSSEEQKRKQDALDAKKRREEQEKTEADRRARANAAREEERRRADEERKKNASRFAERHGAAMGGTSASMSSVGGGSSIPESRKGADINIDRDYQINRRSVDTSRNHAETALGALMVTMARPLTNEIRNNDSIRSGEKNVVLKTAKETAKDTLRVAIANAAAINKLQDNAVKAQESYKAFAAAGGSNKMLSDRVDKLAKKSKEINLDGDLVSGMKKEAAALGKEINKTAAACGFKGYKNISDFNELCKNKKMLEQALRDMKRHGVSADKIKQLKELAKMSKSAGLIARHERIGGGGLKRVLLTPFKRMGDELRQTEQLNILAAGYRYTDMAGRTGAVMLKGGAAAIKGSSAAIIKARAALNAAILRNGGLRGALKAGGMRFISGVRSVPGLVKAVPGIVRKAPKKIGRLAAKGLKRTGNRIVRRAKHVVTAPLRLKKRIAALPGKIASGIKGVAAAWKAATLKSVLKGGLKGIANVFKGGLQALWKKIAVVTKVVGIAFFIFVVQVIVIMATQWGTAALEKIKEVFTAFNDYRHDAEDPRNDTVMGLASEELKYCDVLYSEGLHVFIGGLDTIDDVLEKIPFVGKIAHGAVMDTMDHMAATSGADKNVIAYIYANRMMYAKDLISDSGVEGVQYFKDEPIITATSGVKKEKHGNIKHGASDVWIETKIYTSDDPSSLATWSTDKYSKAIGISYFSDMESINNSISLQFVDGDGNPCGQMSNIKEILSLSAVCFTDAALGHEDFGEDQNYGITGGDTISDKEIKDEAAAMGGDENDSLTGILGFFYFLGKVGDMLDAVEEWNPLRMLCDTLAEVAEDIMRDIFPGFAGFPDITDPTDSFIQSSYCLAAYVSSHRVYVGYRADATTGKAYVIHCNENLPHFDGCDYNTCRTGNIYYVTGKNLSYTDLYDENVSYTFTEGWAIDPYPENHGYFTAVYPQANYGRGSWNSRYCYFISKDYVNKNRNGEQYLAQVVNFHNAGSDAERNLFYARYYALAAEVLGFAPLSTSYATTYHVYTCLGHPYVIVCAKTYTMNTGLFEMVEKVPFMHAVENVMAKVEASMFDGQWQPGPGGKMIHWTDENREWAKWMNGQDWEKNYGLFVGNTAGGHYRIVSKYKVAQILSAYLNDLSFERYYLIYKALRTVGSVPYGSVPDMSDWMRYTGDTEKFPGFRYEGPKMMHPKVYAARDQQGNPLMPDHLNNACYLPWVFAASELNLLQTNSAPPATLKTYSITAQCTKITDNTKWAPGDLVKESSGTLGKMGIFLGYAGNTISPKEYSYVIMEDAWKYDVDELYDAEAVEDPNGKYQIRKGLKVYQSNVMPPDERVINTYGFVVLKKVKTADWVGWRPKCYKDDPFKTVAADADTTFIESTKFDKRKGTNEWIYNAKEDQQETYDRWGATH